MDLHWPEVVALLGVAGALMLMRRIGRRDLDTISGVFWSLRNRLDKAGRIALYVALAALMGWLWLHFVQGGT